MILRPCSELKHGLWPDRYLHIHRSLFIMNSQLLLVEKNQCSCKNLTIFYLISLPSTFHRHLNSESPVFYFIQIVKIL